MRLKEWRRWNAINKIACAYLWKANTARCIMYVKAYMYVVFRVLCPCRHRGAVLPCDWWWSFARALPLFFGFFHSFLHSHSTKRPVIDNALCAWWSASVYPATRNQKPLSLSLLTCRRNIRRTNGCVSWWWKMCCAVGVDAVVVSRMFLYMYIWLYWSKSRQQFAHSPARCQRSLFYSCIDT